MIRYYIFRVIDQTKETNDKFKNDDIFHIIDQTKKTNVKLQKRRYRPHYLSDKEN